jgi:hypothetical protein
MVAIGLVEEAFRRGCEREVGEERREGKPGGEVRLM